MNDLLFVISVAGLSAVCNANRIRRVTSEDNARNIGLPGTLTRSVSEGERFK